MEKSRHTELYYYFMYAFQEYIPIMTDDEIWQLLSGTLRIDEPIVERWEVLLNDKRAKDRARKNQIREAYAKQR